MLYFGSQCWFFIVYINFYNAICSLLCKRQMHWAWQCLSNSWHAERAKLTTTEIAMPQTSDSSSDLVLHNSVAELNELYDIYQWLFAFRNSHFHPNRFQRIMAGQYVLYMQCESPLLRPQSHDFWIDFSACEKSDVGLSVWKVWTKW